MLGLSAEGCGPGTVLELRCTGPPADLRAVLFGSVGKSVQTVQIFDAFGSVPARPSDQPCQGGAHLRRCRSGC